MRDASVQYAVAFAELNDPAATAQFRAFAEAVGRVPELGVFLSRMDVPEGARIEVARALMPGSEERAQRFVSLLVERGLIGSIKKILSRVEAIMDEKTGKARVRVQSAQALDPAQCERLGKWLAERLGKREVTLETGVDAGLLAGFVAEYGSLSLDVSYKGQLERLGKRLMV
jgi:ATP synthase F1 delta subunit